MGDHRRSWAAHRASGLRRAAGAIAALGKHHARDVGAHGLLGALRRAPQPVLDRLQPQRGPARRQLLRPAGQRMPTRELPRDREGRRAAGALVPARPRPHQGPRGPRARQLERVDVRVPDAAARHARLARHAALRDVRDGRRRADRLRQDARRAVGRERVGVQRQGRRPHLPVPGVRRPRARAEARAVRRCRRRAVRRTARAAGRAARGPRPTSPPSPPRVPRAGTATTKRSTTPPGAYRRARPARSSRRTSRTTRAWRSSRWATRWSAARCAIASTPTRWSARRSCFCRSACHATSSSSRRTSKRSRTCARCASFRRRSTRSYNTAETAVPATHFLSNGRYSVMVTNGGGGYSRWNGLAVTRYREDLTRDCWGTFFYVRDVDSGKVFSAPHNPYPTPPDSYNVVFAPDKAEFRRRDGCWRRTSRSRCRPRTTSRSAA